MWYGARARAHSLGVLFPALFLLCFGARAARADEAEVVVRVDCPAFAEEQRSALESRAKTELLVRREKGSLLVACRDGAAELRWQPEAGDVVESRIALAPDPPAIQEQVLEALELLLNPAPAQPPAATAPPVAPPVTPPAPTVAPPKRPPPSAPPPPLARLSESTPSGDVAPPFVEIFAGAALEAWSSEAAAALGPQARVSLALPAGFAASGGALVAWTLRHPNDVAGRLVRAQLGGEYHLDSARRWRIGAAALFDWLTATRDVTPGSETAHDLGFAALVAPRYLLLAPPLRIALGPTLSVRGAPVRVAVGASEVFRIPALAVGATAEIALGPL